MTGNIHSLESFGAADGPGVRFVVFMHGCNFRCAYCHNPDTWAVGEPPLVMTPEAVLERALRYRDYWGTDGGVTLSGGEPMLQAEFSAELFDRARDLGVTTCLDTAAGPFRRGDKNIERLLSLSDTVLLDIKAFDPALHRKVTGSDNSSVLDLTDAGLLQRISIRFFMVSSYINHLSDGATGELCPSKLALECPEICRR